MPVWIELLLLAVASMFWPTLIVIVVIALRLSHPIKILLGFLVGGLLTTIAIGTAIVFALQGASFLSGTRPTIDPVIDLVMGLLSLVAAAALLHGAGRAAAKPRPEPEASTTAKKPLTQRAVERGAPVAFAFGVVLNIVPGTFPIVALKDIAELDAGDGVKFATIVVFYVIMFAFVEVPIVAFLFAPERTTVAVGEFNDWLKRNGRRIAAYVIGAVGLYLVVRGLLRL